MRKIILLLCSTLLLVLLFLSATLLLTGKLEPVPKIEQGLINLTHWDFSQNGSVSLSGDWEFYWEQHIPPNGDALSEPGFIKAPKSWNNYEENGETISGRGFATYRATVLLGEKRRGLSLKLLDMATAFRLYINGDLVASSGKAGQTPETTIPFYSPKVVKINSDYDRMDIIIHVSNFNHWQGGMWEPIILGADQVLKEKREKRIVLDFFIFGSILMMGLYHLSLYGLRKQNKSNLYFGCLCLLLSIRILAQGERYIVNLFPGISYEVLLKMTYISFYLCVPVFAMYMRSFYPEEAPKKVLRIVQIIGSVFTIGVLFLPARIYTYGMPVFQALSFVLLVYGSWVILMANVRKRDGAFIFLFGFIVLMLTVINDILYARQFIITGYYAPFGLVAFIFCQTILLSQQFSQTFLLIEQQSHDLKKEIADRIKVENMLQSFFDGISEPLIMIGRDLTVKMLNKKAVEYYDAGNKEVIGLVCYKALKNRSVPCEDCRIPSFINRKKPYTFEQQSPINSERVEKIVLYPLENGEDILIRIDDITKSRIMHKKLVQNEKLAALGFLISGIAHEINNPNNFISFNIPILRDYIDELIPIIDEYSRQNEDYTVLNMPYSEFREDIFKLIDNLEHGSQRINRIVSGLKEFARPKNQIQWQKVNLRSIIEKSITMCKGKINREVKYFETDLPESLPIVTTDPEILEQILINLIINGVQACDKENSRLSVKAFVSNKDDGKVHIEVKDNGCGMDKETQSRIFDPFFTTKKPGEGTGLGMSVCQNLIEALNGDIEVNTFPGQGSIFKIILPIKE